MPWAGFSLARLVGQWIGLRQNGRAVYFADRDWQIVTWSAVMAVILGY
jgi:hypothetical protein